MNNIDISYIDNGVESDQCILVIHGWGNNKESMLPLSNSFDNSKVVTIDLPGFGSSKLNDNLTVYDYAATINKFVLNKKYKNITIIGHSFGGKVAMVYASKYNVNKLVVMGSPYKKTNISVLKKVFYSMAKKVKIKCVKDIYIKLFGSDDYKKSDPKLREVLKSTVSTDISEDIKKIKCPTLLIWGELDDAVNISDAYEISNMIDDSAVIKIEGASHYAYLEQTQYIYNIIKSFIKDR